MIRADCQLWPELSNSLFSAFQGIKLSTFDIHLDKIAFVQTENLYRLVDCGRSARALDCTFKYNLFR